MKLTDKILLIGLFLFINSYSGSFKKYHVLVSERGGRVDWSYRSDLIVHSRYGKDGYYDVWIMKSNGSDARCLTCNISKIPSLHNGQPSWHPDGRYIVFQSQDTKFPHTKKIDYLYTQPGHGLHNNLWIMDLKNRNFYQLTKVKFEQAILHPSFSPDGKKLLWTQKMGKDKFNWSIMVADFVEKPIPHIENVKSYQPEGKVWYEAHQFSKDCKKILCTIGSGKRAYYGYDIWEMDIKTQKLKRLTFSPDVWDEHAHYSPDGKKICWVSSQGYKYTPERWSRTLKTELWIMNSDGSKKRKITHFNEPGHPEYIGERVIISDNCWSPDGKKIVITLVKPFKGRSSSQILLIPISPGPN